MPWTDPAKRKIYQQHYYLRNREKVLAGNAAWQKANPEKARARGRVYDAKHIDKNALRARRYYFERGGKEKQQERLFARKYGITVGQYRELLEVQGGACAICHYVPRRMLDVDHDHETGEVRGLLCNRCNKGLTMFREDADCFVRAAEYLREAECKLKLWQLNALEFIPDTISKMAS